MPEINNTICEKSNKILKLADEMASAAASFNSQQGYDQFIQARDSLREAARKLYVDEAVVS